MSDSELPPKKSSGGLVVLGILLFIGAGGALAWKLTSGSGDEEVVEERITQQAPQKEIPVLDEPPPPPPPEEEIAAAEKKDAPAAAGTTKSSGPAGCNSNCVGNAGSDLQTALRSRAGQARGCYNRALRQNDSLEGKMSVAVHISPTGLVCSASVTSDTLGDPAVSSCVSQMFRSGKYPAPSGGCVQTVVPINFVAK